MEAAPWRGSSVERTWAFWAGWIPTFLAASAVGLWLALRLVWSPFATAFGRLRRRE